VIRYGQYGWKIQKKSKLNRENIWKLWKKSKLNSEKIWEIQKKSKLNSEKIWLKHQKSINLIVLFRGERRQKLTIV
jgi:translation initiation factor IF-3